MSITKVVTIGGGTGQFTLLSALRDFNHIDITAVVSMADSGGSTGRLRDEYGVLPPGDVLKCLIALSPLKDARTILQQRFQYHEKLKNHNAGNLLLVFLSQYLSNDFAAAIEALGEILNIKGTVLPVTTDKATLVAQLADGKKVFGEADIDVARGERDAKITETFLVPHGGTLAAYPDAVAEIVAADYVIIGPGDLYTSITPNFLVPGVTEAVSRSSARFIYLPNIMTKHGETDGFTTKDFVSVVEKYLNRNLDIIIANNTPLNEAMKQKYQTELAEPVKLDQEHDWGDRTLLALDLLRAGNFARHDVSKLKDTFSKLF